MLLLKLPPPDIPAAVIAAAPPITELRRPCEQAKGACEPEKTHFDEKGGQNRVNSGAGRLLFCFPV
ncbi:hypothetical protein Pla52o_52810 [Novipirellula galeiformis]|uniref:Uncharacterized protein n=1 Tax=Novipirellula galeiformis TaxID=2528004 RepID=A0A5C6BZA4_9BACT|nr:hypothetical protein Pla52o_52810 [Novipirellula galeiformis]